MFDEKPPGQWTDQPIISIGQYHVRTDFEGFWNTLESGEAVIYCQHQFPKFFSKTPDEFIKSKGAAAKRFAEKRIGWIDPKLYNAGQGLTEHEIYSIRDAALNHRKPD